MKTETDTPQEAAGSSPCSGSRCKCGEESTGWTEIKCCNICGLPHADEDLDWRISKMDDVQKAFAALGRAILNLEGESGKMHIEASLARSNGDDEHARFFLSRESQAREDAKTLESLMTLIQEARRIQNTDAPDYEQLNQLRTLFFPVNKK